MKEKLESQIDALAGFASPAIPDSQASDYINQAMHSLVKKMVIEGLEKNEYNRQFTAPLKKSYESALATDQTGASKHGVFFKLPDDFYLMLSENITTDQRDCFTGELIDNIDVFPIGEDYKNINKSNHQKQPFIDTIGNSGLVWRVSFGKDNSNKFSELITDGKFNVYKYNFRYLSKPIKVNIDIDNPSNQIFTNIYDEFHDDLIDKAALIAIENMRMVSRFQSKAILNKEQDL